MKKNLWGKNKKKGKKERKTKHKKITTKKTCEKSYSAFFFFYSIGIFFFIYI
jgi:hypothetical protein